VPNLYPASAIKFKKMRNREIMEQEHKRRLAAVTQIALLTDYFWWALAGGLLRKTKRIVFLESDKSSYERDKLRFRKNHVRTNLSRSGPQHN